MDQLSSTCRRYTDVMALKNQLQCHVFTGTADIATRLTPFIIDLQLAAAKLQRIEVSINLYSTNDTSCIQFVIYSKNTTTMKEVDHV